MAGTRPGLARTVLIGLLLAFSSAGCELLLPRLQGGGATPRPSLPMPCAPEGPASAVPECLPPQGILLVSIHEPSGAPITEFSVAYDGPGTSGSFDYKGTGDPGGPYDLHVPIGSYTITFSAAGHRDVAVPVTVHDGESQPLTVVMPLAP